MTIHTDALAQRYATSLYELADEAGGQEKLAEIADELEQVCELARADHAFSQFLASPVIDREKRNTSLRHIFANRVTDLTLRFLLVLNDKGRLAHLEQINSAFDQMIQERYGRIEVDVYTPAPLGAEAMEVIRARVREALQREPVLHSYPEPAMLGGLKLRIGDRLIDGSVSSRIRQMKRELLTSGTSAIRSRFSRIVGEPPATNGTAPPA